MSDREQRNKRMPPAAERRRKAERRRDRAAARRKARRPKPEDLPEGFGEVKAEARRRGYKLTVSRPRRGLQINFRRGGWLIASWWPMTETLLIGPRKLAAESLAKALELVERFDGDRPFTEEGDVLPALPKTMNVGGGEAARREWQELWTSRESDN